MNVCRKTVFPGHDRAVTHVNSVAGTSSLLRFQHGWGRGTLSEEPSALEGCSAMVCVGGGEARAHEFGGER